MNKVGQIERTTENRVVKLFQKQLGYFYLGNWEGREDNSKIEEDLLRKYLSKKKKYSETLINKALYEFSKAATKSDSLINKGISTVVFDCTGKPVETRDAKGALTLQAYDFMQRPVNIWCRDIETEYVTKRQVLYYGLHSYNNTRGKLTDHYDESGCQYNVIYDFKGNLLNKIKQVIDNKGILNAINQSAWSGWYDMSCYRVNWDADTSLTGYYETNMEYDALNRITKLIYPVGALGTRSELYPHYNKAGALQSINFNGAEYIQHIAYNAKGQRLLIAYGNNLMTRYTYNEHTFRLERMRTERYFYSQDGGGNHHYEYDPGTCRQDFAYVYDKAGNILNINNETPQCGEYGGNELTRVFEYDALYRLLKATGRENQPSDLYWNDSYRSDDPYSTTGYEQHYAYDLMGNINELAHSGINSFTRTYTHTNNLLQNFEVGGNVFSYEYDACGNQIKENQERNMQWDYGDKMRLFYNQTSPGNEPSMYTHYLYDASGNRVKKFTRTAGGNWETITYIDGLIEYREDQYNNRQSISHVMDDTKRIATIREGYDFGDSTPAIKYNLDDHLGSSNVLVDENGTLVNFEEYYPFGETSFGSYGKKRYRFCGKERDEESGMYYYGARYYSPWLCRFVSVDPLAGKYPFYTPYQYAGNQPINFIDLDGMEQANPQTPSGGSASTTPEVNNTAGASSKPPVNITPSTGDLLNAALKSFSGAATPKPTLSQTINKELKGTQAKPDNTQTPKIDTKTVAQITKITLPNQGTITATDPLKGKSDFERGLIQSPIVQFVAVGGATTVATVAAAPLAVGTGFQRLGAAVGDVSSQLANNPNIGELNVTSTAANATFLGSSYLASGLGSFAPVTINDLLSGNPLASMSKESHTFTSAISNTLISGTFDILGGVASKSIMTPKVFGKEAANQISEKFIGGFFGSQGATITNSLIDSYYANSPLQFKF